MNNVNTDFLDAHMERVGIDALSDEFFEHYARALGYSSMAELSAEVEEAQDAELDAIAAAPRGAS